MDEELDDAGVLVTEGGKELPQLKLTASMLLDKTLITYGPSGSGKTVTIKHLMSLLHGHIDQVIVVAPTEPANRSYAGWVDPSLIHYHLHLPHPDGKKEAEAKGALRFLEAIYQRQAMLAAISTRANDPATLALLFRRLAPALRAEGLRYIEAINGKRRRVLERLGKEHATNEAQLAVRTKDVNGKFRQMLVLIYKKYITAGRAALWALNLPEDELYSLTYIQLNPRLLLIFDDCAAQLKLLFNSPTWRNMFYAGRWGFLTTIVSCQDDTDLPANLRKNAFLSFFMEPIVCSSNFDRKSNQFSKAVKTLIQEIVADVYRRRNRKLVYLRDDRAGHHYYHFEAPEHKPFLFGSPALHELCALVQTTEVTMDKANPYYDKFKIS